MLSLRLAIRVTIEKKSPQDNSRDRAPTWKKVGTGAISVVISMTLLYRVIQLVLDFINYSAM